MLQGCSSPCKLGIGQPPLRGYNEGTAMVWRGLTRGLSPDSSAQLLGKKNSTCCQSCGRFFQVLRPCFRYLERALWPHRGGRCKQHQVCLRLFTHETKNGDVIGLHVIAAKIMHSGNHAIEAVIARFAIEVSAQL